MPALRSRPARHAFSCTLLLAASPLAPGAESHFVAGPLENPVFVNSIVGTDLLWGNGYYGRDIVIAHVEGGHFVALTVADGENDDWSLSPFSQSLADFDTIHVRQAQIKDDQIRFIGRS